MFLGSRVTTAGAATTQGITEGRTYADLGSLSFEDLPYLLPFLALFLIQLVHHNMWRDELNAFGIAVASPTLASLFYHVHYEGHPWLWYALLWIVTKFTVFPWGMKVLEAFVGTGIYLMIWLASPFSRWEKVLLSLSFYITFEYTVMSRMYGVMLLLALIYIRQRTMHPQRILRIALLLGLIASTDAMGVILSIALLSEYGYSLYKGDAGSSAHSNGKLAGAGLIYMALLAFSIYSAKVTSAISWRTTGRLFVYATSPKHLLESSMDFISLPYFLAEVRPIKYFWVFPQGPVTLYCLCIPLVLLAYWIIFRKHGSLLLQMGVVIVGGVLFGHLIYRGAQRHFGITFIVFLMGLWMLRSKAPRLPTVAYLLLGLSAISGIAANIGEWRGPFSNAEPTANWLKANHLDQAPLVGTPDTTVASVAELLHRPVYMLDCNCSDTFLLFSNRRDSFSMDQIPDRLVLAAKSLGVGSFLFLDGFPMGTEEQAAIVAKGLTVTQLKSFTGAEVEQEDFYVYRISTADEHASMRP